MSNDTRTVVDFEQWQEGLESRLGAMFDARDRDRITRDDIASAIETAFRRVLSDEKLRAQFWEAGYVELAKHASNGASQWVGRRLLVALVWAGIGAGLAWLVKSGALK